MKNKSGGRFRLAYRLAAIHLGLLLIVGLLLLVSPDGGMVFGIFQALDFPLSHYYHLLSFLPLAVVLGTLLWGCYGFILQSIGDGQRRRLAAGVVAAAVICLLPELGVRSLPAWEAEWRQGAAAGQDRDYPASIDHIRRAIELSPPDNPMLHGMWEFLGRMYRDSNDIPMAEAAFRNSLAAVDANPRPLPSDRLNAYNQLAAVYQGSGGDPLLHKDALMKSIDEDRRVYGADSVQEADCWAELAQIAHDGGDKAEARQLMERAIAMESARPGPGSVDYRKHVLQKWSAE